MGKSWNFCNERLSAKAGETSATAKPKRVAARNVFPEKARIEEAVAQRFNEVAQTSASEPKLSPVERAMRRNAPDLAGAPQEEVQAAAKRRAAHLDAKWPRPRLAALIVIGLIMWLHPLSTIQLFVCAVFLFLVVAVAVGPERARDGSFFLWRRFLRYWKVEMAVTRRLFYRSSTEAVEPAE